MTRLTPVRAVPVVQRVDDTNGCLQPMAVAGHRRTSCPGKSISAHGGQRASACAVGAPARFCLPKTDVAVHNDDAVMSVALNPEGEDRMRAGGVSGASQVAGMRPRPLLLRASGGGLQHTSLTLEGLRNSSPAPGATAFFGAAKVTFAVLGFRSPRNSLAAYAARWADACERATSSARRALLGGF